MGGETEAQEGRKDSLRSHVSMWVLGSATPSVVGVPSAPSGHTLSREFSPPAQTQPLGAFKHLLFLCLACLALLDIHGPGSFCHSGDRPDVTSSKRASLTTPGPSLSRQLV